METVEIIRLWALLNYKYRMGTFTFDQFKQKMSTVQGRLGFYNKYGKDLNLGDYKEWEKIFTPPTQTQNPPSNPPVNTNTPANTNTIGPKFQCLVNDSIYGGMVEPLDDTHVFFHEDRFNVEYHFYSNGKFKYTDKGNGQSLDGNWSCDGGNGFIARTSDGFYFKSKSPGWKSTSVNETVIKKIVGDNLKSLLK